MKFFKRIILLLLAVFGFWGYTIACTNPLLSAMATNSLCNGGSITLSATGGNPPFTFSWSGPNGYTASTQSITNLAPGTYTVTVAGGGCSATTSAVISQPATMAIAPAATIACTGKTFNLAANASGGTSPYTYSWSGPNSFTATSQNPVVTNVSAASAGNYTLTITDANSCTKTASVAVAVYNSPVLSPYATAITCNGGNDGSASLSVSGATSYTYLWTGPNGYTNTGQNIAFLAAGNYNITVTTGNGCTNMATVTVAQNTAVGATASSNSPACAGSALNLFGSGFGGTGAGTYSYSWSGPNGFTSTIANPVITPSSTTQTGTYTLTVKDAHNCAQTTSASVSVLTSPGTLSTTVTNTVCNGDSTGAISLTLSSGGQYSTSWTGPNGYHSSGSANIAGIAAGAYTAIVIVPSGCSLTAFATVNQPPAIQVLSAATHPLCSGNTLNFNATAAQAVGALSYSWTGPNGFTALGQSPFIPNAGYFIAGDYTVTVKDANNCRGKDLVHVTIDTVPAPNITQSDAKCHGSHDGAVYLNPTGGAPFVFSWTGTGGFTSNMQYITTLSAGTYTVTVTNATGCSATAAAIINEPLTLNATAATNSPLCAGGILQFTDTVSGGTAPFVFTWSGPNAFTAASQYPSLLVTTAAAGTYTLSVKDVNGCIKTVNTAPVSIVPAPVLTASVTRPVCFGNVNGSIALVVSGGIAPFNFLWAGPGMYSAAIQNISALAAGTYSVSITGGCKGAYTDTIILTQPAVLNGTVAVPVVCAGDTLHILSAIAGGTQPYTYNWAGPAGFVAHIANPAITHSALANSGIYALALHDANNCTFTGSDTGIVKPAPALYASNDTAICAGNSVILSISGNTYPVVWSTGDTGQSVTVALPGAYIVTATAQNGCRATDTILVRVDSAPHISGIQAFHTGSTFSFAAVDPQFIAGYNWNFGDGSFEDSITALHNYTATGTYMVTLIGSNACGSDTITTTVRVDTLTGVSQVTGLMGIDVYPNPSNGYINVAVQQIKMKHLYITNIAGQTVLDKQLDTSGPYTINTGNITPGLYILYIDTDKGRLVRKVTITR